MSHLVDHGDQLDRQHTEQQPSPGTARALIYRGRTARPQVPRESNVWTARDGRAVRLRVFKTRDQALEAGGLSE
jgi:hypothetical protein